MTFRFIAEARAEYTRIISYYEAECKGLGSQFDDEVRRACRKLQENPYLWRVRPDGYRRLLLARFPYFLIFVTRGDVIHIVALAHTSRYPGYWYGRRTS